MYCSRSFLSFQQSSQHFTKTRFHLKKTLSLLIHKKQLLIHSCFIMLSSVTQSCLTLCDTMNCSTPGLPVHRQLLELTRLMSIESVMPSNDLILCCPFSSRLQSFPASGSFQMSQFFPSGGQSIGVSALASILPMNIQH